MANPQFIRKWKTSDGQEHTDYTVAQTHERKLSALTDLRKVLDRPNSGSLAVDVYNSVALLTTLRNACNKALEIKRKQNVTATAAKP